MIVVDIPVTHTIEHLVWREEEGQTAVTALWQAAAYLGHSTHQIYIYIY